MEQSIFKKGLKSLSGIWQTKKQTPQSHQNLVFNELSRFVQFFINFQLSFELANTILLHYCDMYQIE